MALTRSPTLGSELGRETEVEVEAWESEGRLRVERPRVRCRVAGGLLGVPALEAETEAVEEVALGCLRMVT